jgi:excinuclease ABC subunit A
MENIEVRGARTHNLKNINVTIPRDKFVVITGLSGSGKSSLAFDTLYAEGQRRYVESLSPYARQFLAKMEKPDVDSIEGLSPAISIQQKSASNNPRSTVGTVTEIYDYLRLLFSRTGEARCPVHKKSLNAQTISQMVDQVMSLPEDTKLMILAPVVNERKGEYKKLLQSLASEGFIRARIDGEVYDLSDPPELQLRKKHTIEVIVDRFKVKADVQQRIAESFETALKKSDGLVYVDYVEPQPGQKKMVFSNRFACPVCGYSLSELEPKLFSFNNPNGACPECGGLGEKEILDMSELIRDPKKTIADGAIKGWDSNYSYYYSILEAVAKHFKFSIDVPYSKLTDAQKNLLLNGTGDVLLNLPRYSPYGYDPEVDTATEKKTFDGIVKITERRRSDYYVYSNPFRSVFRAGTCPLCHGSRLNEKASNVFINNMNILDVINMPVAKAETFFKSITFTGQKEKIAEKLLKEIRDRLSFLVNVGLGYLTLARSADTLSGGEAQRIRLASQIGAGLVGVMYVLDEPSIGLHQRDNTRLLSTLQHLKELGNTVIVVEHDEETMLAADYLIDIGPGAGVHGGRIIAEGTPQDVISNRESLTGDYLSGRKVIPVPTRRSSSTAKWLKINGVSKHNLKNVDLALPLGLFTCITGVSGSGKSTLINDVLHTVANCSSNRSRYDPYSRAQLSNTANSLCTGTEGFEYLDNVIAVDQSPIGRTPRSNPATYIGVFTEIRELFAATPEARTRGYKSNRFSFNVGNGRCSACQGDGLVRVSMNFLPDIFVPCDVCRGDRYNRETLEVKYKDKTIADVLRMPVEEAYEFFKSIPLIASKLRLLMDVGLSYITLGQSATTLSGGEAQRIKLAKELSKRDTTRTLYILDEPTTGLHFQDVALLLKVLLKLRDRGNTIVVIEHNMDVIKTADWIVDLGPEGGEGGGKIIAQGTPEHVSTIKKSFTGKFLRDVLGKAKEKNS